MNNNLYNVKEENKFIHGGDIYSDGLLKGKELLDFSSNINPLGVPASFSDNIDEGIKAALRYPDIKYRLLKKNILNYLKGDFLNEENIILGNGATEIIDLSISCFKKIVIIVPSFLEYEINAKKWKCEIEYSYLDINMCIDYKDLFKKIINSDALIIGNPNNPNGETIEKEKFYKLLDFAEENNKTVIMDEAFIEFTGSIDNSFKNSFQDKIKDYRCILIIRALTKFFGSPGIRLGYGISSDLELLSKIREKQNPWNINCFAEVAAKYMLADKEYITESIEWINKERVYLTSELQKISFIKSVFTTKANFVLCQLKNINSNQLYGFCLEKGIIIRRTSNFRGLNDNYVRLAIKDRKSNDSLLSTFHSVEAGL